MIKRIAIVLAVLIAVTAVPEVSWAASPWTQETTYGGKTLGKLRFGLENALAGWTALFTTPVERYKEHKGAIYVTEGVFDGITHAIVYTVGGIIHLATFPAPVDVPLINDGVKLFDKG